MAHPDETSDAPRQPGQIESRRGPPRPRAARATRRIGGSSFGFGPYAGGSKTWRAARVAIPLCCVALAKAAVGCGAARSQEAGGPQSADQQSIAEYNLGRESFQTGRLREALDHVEKALKLDDENADAAFLGASILLGFCAKDERSSDCRYNEAEGYARRAVKANPELRDAKNTLGVVLVHEKKYDDAIGVLKPLANDILYGSPEKAWGNLGWAYATYVAAGEWEGRAGAYAVQGFGASLVERIEGDYLNVVGLPASLLVRLLAERFSGTYGFG